MQGMGLEEACLAALEDLGSNQGGLIAIDHRGQVVMPFNCPGMFRAACSSSSVVDMEGGASVRNKEVGIWERE